MIAEEPLKRCFLHAGALPRVPTRRYLPLAALCPSRRSWPTAYDSLSRAMLSVVASFVPVAGALLEGLTERLEGAVASLFRVAPELRHFCGDFPPMLDYALKLYLVALFFPRANLEVVLPMVVQLPWQLQRSSLSSLSSLPALSPVVSPRAQRRSTSHRNAVCRVELWGRSSSGQDSS
ncbi:hypothetical protein Esti_001683 [Eimeria stiedai]